MSSSGCSHDDRFGKHFRNCRNREGHEKASVLLPDIASLIHELRIVKKVTTKLISACDRMKSVRFVKSEGA